MSEADFFITNICNYLHLSSGSKVWDLACGKGRHSITLSKKQYQVIGTDLSEKSIQEALHQKEQNVDFFIHDMRKPFRSNYFDCVMNLFTSLGYFENAKDNLTVFKNVQHSLKPGGIFVVDFFNSQKVEKNLVKNKIENRGDIQFHISKKIENNCIIKEIKFHHNDKDYCFEESVSLLKKEDFEDFADKSGLNLIQTFGDYSLNAYDPEHSERLILIFKK